MKKEWIELKVRGAESKKNDAASMLIDAGSPGIVEIESKKKTAKIELKAYLPLAKKSQLGNLKSSLLKFGFSVTTSDYTEEDWSKKWKQHIRPVRAGGFLVRAQWSKARARPGEKVIEIDPGMAFGTGGHNSTRLCLRGLTLKSIKEVVRGANVLDVGTGSGILAIAAKKLGAARVVAIDIDPVALKVARVNAKNNNVSITISQKKLTELRESFSIVLANILSTVLIENSRELSEPLKKGGFLILSGILKEEAEDVVVAFLPFGLKKQRSLSSGEWSGLILKKKD